MAGTKREVLQISSYSRRLRDNIKSILDNYGEILKAAKVTKGEGQSNEYDATIYHAENEIEIRAANMVRAAEALSRLVAELKEYLILNDFSAINESVTQRTLELEKAKETMLNEVQRDYDTYGQEQLKSLDTVSYS